MYVFEYLKNRHECEACGQENEMQENILKCEIILKKNKESEKVGIPKYYKFLYGNVN